MRRWLAVYIVPGAVLQSVMIGGGYGTGREVVEYFTRFGMLGGLAGIAVATISIAVIFALSLEVSRSARAYDYRSFFQQLLGPAWILYELLVLMLFMLVIAVIGAAAGSILNTELGLPPVVGVGTMLMIVVVLTFFGRELVTRVLTWWSLVLYLVFLVYLSVVVGTYPERMRDALAGGEIIEGWLGSGLLYSFYNITAIPVILYAAHAIETRREALTSGVIGALIGILPALFLHLSFGARHPEILDAELPIYVMFDGLGSPLLKLAYLMVLFGTFIETGAGNIQGFLERVDGWWQERTGGTVAPWMRALIAALAVGSAGTLSALGIVALIGQGYSTLAWGFLLVYVLPLLTVGLWKILRSG